MVSTDGNEVYDLGKALGDEIRVLERGEDLDHPEESLFAVSMAQRDARMVIFSSKHSAGRKLYQLGAN
jgi:urease accessory protein UreE